MGYWNYGVGWELLASIPLTLTGWVPGVVFAGIMLGNEEEGEDMEELVQCPSKSMFSRNDDFGGLRSYDCASDKKDFIKGNTFDDSLIFNPPIRRKGTADQKGTKWPLAF